jgi:hypothetical protein
MVDTQQVHSSVEEPFRPLSASTPSTAGAPEGNGVALAALIVGVVALVAALVPFVNYGSWLVALVGLVLGVVALARKNGRRSVAVAGIVISSAAVIASVVLAILYSLLMATAAGMAEPAPTPGPAGADPSPAGHDGATNGLATRENPAPLGTTVRVPSSAGTLDWEVTLGPAMLDADEVVAAENPSAEPAPDGSQYAMVPVTVVYRGAESGTPWAELAVGFVSAAGTVHSSSDSFAVAPTPLTDVKELVPGAAGTGNVVVPVPAEDVAEGAWVVTSEAGDQYFFAAQ